MSSDLTIGLLGAGKMATALAKGFLDAKLVAPDRLLASDTFDAARQAFTKETGARAVGENLEVARFGRVLILAVKPNQVADVLKEIQAEVTDEHLLISIAAGVSTQKLETALGKPARMIRVMPNTPALVAASASAFCLGRAARPKDADLARKLFGAVGLAFQVKEELMDAVTGLSGSGPAYAYLIIEALSDGGVAAGMPRDVAIRLAAQTLLGAARMVLETGLHPAALKDMVTSPGGTTIDGLHELEKAGVRGALINAVRAAADKSRELGRAG